jgi:catechol 2,3-dioxygenase-like lactoylglutathione lyase family enzyme
MNLYMIELSVVDWPAAVAWYRDVLGLKVLMRVEEDRFALLQAGEGRIALKQASVPRDSNPERHRIGILCHMEVPDLSAELARLEGLGVTVERPLQSSKEGYRRAVIRDPDGYRLCLFDWGAKES